MSHRAPALLAEIRHSFANARAWALIALVAFIYVIIAIAGDGTLLWGLVLISSGVPVFYGAQITRQKETR